MNLKGELSSIYSRTNHVAPTMWHDPVALTKLLASTSLPTLVPIINNPYRFPSVHSQGLWPHSAPQCYPTFNLIFSTYTDNIKFIIIKKKYVCVINKDFISSKMTG